MEQKREEFHSIAKVFCIKIRGICIDACPITLVLINYY